MYLFIEKKSSTKKMPNFERIHEKLFSKAESLVDAKQRLEDRYAAFSNLIISIILIIFIIDTYFYIN